LVIGREKNGVQKDDEEEDSMSQEEEDHIPFAGGGRKRRSPSKRVRGKGLEVKGDIKIISEPGKVGLCPISGKKEH